MAKVFVNIVSVTVTTVDGERVNTTENDAKVKGQVWVNHAFEVRYF